jgi:hypothetical protein
LATRIGRRCDDVSLRDDDNFSAIPDNADLVRDRKPVGVSGTLRTCCGIRGPADADTALSAASLDESVRRRRLSNIAHAHTAVSQHRDIRAEHCILLLRSGPA